MKMFKLRRITTRAMMPALRPGSTVSVHQKKPKVGDIVLASIGDKEVFRRVIGYAKEKVIVADDHMPKTKDTVSLSMVVGVVGMVFPAATQAPKPHVRHARIWASIPALILIAMATTQLMTFDRFIVLLDSYWLPVRGSVLGAVLVTLTVAALPYLMHMWLSPLARIVSMVSGWFIALMWLGLGIYVNVTTHSLSSTGLLGSLIDTPPGIWAIVFGLLLCVLIGVANWALGVAKLPKQLDT